MNGTEKRNLADRLIFDHISQSQVTVEFFYGLLMAMALSNTLRLALLGQPAEEIAFVVTVAILGCNTAWGFADGAVNMLTSHYEKVYFYRKVKEIKDGKDHEASRELAVEVLTEALTELQEDMLDEDTWQRMADVAIQAIKKKEIVRPTLERSQWLAAVWCVLLNLAAATPFVLIYQLAPTIDLNLVTFMANVTGAILLFLLGRFLERKVGSGGLRSGLVMAGVGMLMLLIIVALGG
ncbi:MAG: hypothetical protein NT131_01265 [Methanomassiliicoccales archaeon]|nr:hypothetical protein [Methanomassiliicoccales archaeon]